MISDIPWKRIRLLIIDMDNTLCDTLHTLSRPQWIHVERELKARGLVEEAGFIKRNFGKQSFLRTLEASGMSRADMTFALKTYDRVDVKTLKLFSDAKSVLAVPLPKVLLTRGELSLQRKKIAHLGLRPHFSDVRIVSTFQSKRTALKSILLKHRLRPKEALVIGDRIEEEIMDAKALGIPAVLVRRPDWPLAKSRVKPDMVVRDLHTVAKALRLRKG